MFVRAAYGLARVLRVPWLYRRFSGGALILCYHNVVTEAEREARDPALHLDVDAFEAQMQWVCRHLQPIGLDALVNRLRHREPTRDLVSVTFDDGYEGFFRSALPVLRSLRVPSTVFIVAEAPEHPFPYWWDHPTLVRRATPERRTQWLTRARGITSAIFEMEGLRAPDGLPSELLPASWETIRANLGADLTIGAHTCRHPALPTLSAAELRRELELGAERIEQRLGRRPGFLAYPYGAWSVPVRDATRAAGYEAAFTLDAVRIRRPDIDLLALPRVNVPATITPAAFEAWASGLLPPARTGP
jgi:peptidoglycan/xylan/chitin deacetylase (PgdA/CDA1 family)